MSEIVVDAVGTGSRGGLRLLRELVLARDERLHTVLVDGRVRQALDLDDEDLLTEWTGSRLMWLLRRDRFVNPSQTLVQWSTPFPSRRRNVIYLQQAHAIQKGRHLFPGRARYDAVRFLTRSAMRSSLLTVVQTEWVRSVVAASGTAGPIEVIVPVSNASVDASIDMSPPSLVAVGGPARHKRNDIVHAAIEELRRLGFDGVIEVYGSDSRCDSADATYQDASETQTQNAVRQAGVYLSCSELETVGLSNMDAMAGGTAPVVPDLPYARALFGDSALYFNAGDALGAAEKIMGLLKEDDLRRLYGELARRRYGDLAEKYSPWTTRLLDVCGAAAR